MQHATNNSILDIKTVNDNGIIVTYRLFENEYDSIYHYSALISARISSEENEDFFISNLSTDKDHAISLFRKLHENIVLPCEIEVLYSDGFDSIIGEIL